jgi:hypothetical protein
MKTLAGKRIEAECDRDGKAVSDLDVKRGQSKVGFIVGASFP